MAPLDVTGTIGSLLDFYKHEKQIFGRCPHCKLPFRLSEVKLTYGKEPPKDLLTPMRAERERLLGELDELQSEIEGMEMEHGSDIEALEVRWKNKVAVEVAKQLLKTKGQIRKDAVAKSRVSQLGKTLEK
jgi:hypothetical protein